MPQFFWIFFDLDFEAMNLSEGHDDSGIHFDQEETICDGYD